MSITSFLLLLLLQPVAALLPQPRVIQRPSCIGSRGGVAFCTLLPPVDTLLAVDLPDASFLPPEGQTFIKENAFLLGVLFTILTRLLINEIRQRIEKPVLDEAGRRVAANLTPDADAIEPAAFSKLAGCVAMDAAGDASELVPVLGEFTDVAFAPLEAYLLKILFGSNVIAGFGFVEELLPFTDIIPTFTLAWCLSNLWPTTPLAQKLLPDSSKAGGGGSGDK